MYITIIILTTLQNQKPTGSTSPSLSLDKGEHVDRSCDSRRSPSPFVGRRRNPTSKRSKRSRRSSSLLANQVILVNWDIDNLWIIYG